MAITYGATSTLTSGAGTDTADIPFPSGISANDLLVASILWDSGSGGSMNGLTTPSGWTLIESTINALRRRAAAYYKVASGSESGNQTFTCSSSTVDATGYGHITRYSGNATSGTIVEGADTNEANSTTVAQASLTTTSTNELAVALITKGSDAGVIPTMTGMTGGTWVEDNDQQLTSAAEFTVSHADMASAGTISGGTCTINSFRWHCITFAIMPAAATTSFPPFTPLSSSYFQLRR